jgi:hypothetical protein
VEPLRILVEAFERARLVEIVAGTVQFDESITLTVEIDKATFVLSAGDVQIVSGDVAKLASKPNFRGRWNRVKDARKLTVDDLKARGLPLYWNEAWLRSELERCGTYTGVAREHGFANPTTIAAYAKRNFGWDVQREYDEKRNAAVREYRAAAATDSPITHAKIAEQYGVAVATVFRWLKEHRDGIVYDPNRKNRRRRPGVSK